MNRNCCSICPHSSPFVKSSFAIPFLLTYDLGLSVPDALTDLPSPGSLSFKLRVPVYPFIFSLHSSHGHNPLTRQTTPTPTPTLYPTLTRIFSLIHFFGRQTCTPKPTSHRQPQPGVPTYHELSRLSSQPFPFPGPPRSSPRCRHR